MFFCMDFSRTRKNARIFRAMTGMTVSEFDLLVPVFEQVWGVYIREERRFLRHGTHTRERALWWGREGYLRTGSEKLFFILFFLKVYPTCDLAGYTFGSSKSSAARWIQILLPLLSKTLGRTLSLPKRQISTPEEFFLAFPEAKELMIDGVERPMVRRKKPKTQTKNYSGKKKWPRRKNTVIAEKNKRIGYISPTKHRKIHDKKQLDTTTIIPHIPEEVPIFADSGFQWLRNNHRNSYLPTKNSKKHPLTKEQKEENHIISSIRVVVENAICWMKRFKTASDIFRGRQWQDDTYMEVCAWLWNFHIQMKECWIL